MPQTEPYNWYALGEWKRGRLHVRRVVSGRTLARVEKRKDEVIVRVGLVRDHGIAH